MPTGINEEGIGFETRSSGVCDPTDEKPNSLLWWVLGIGVIAAMMAYVNVWEQSESQNASSGVIGMMILWIPVYNIEIV